MARNWSGGSFASAKATFVGVVLLSSSASLTAIFWMFSIFFFVAVAKGIEYMYPVFYSGTN